MKMERILLISLLFLLLAAVVQSGPATAPPVQSGADLVPLATKRFSIQVEVPATTTDFAVIQVPPGQSYILTYARILSASSPTFEDASEGRSYALTLADLSGGDPGTGVQSGWRMDAGDRLLVDNLSKLSGEVLYSAYRFRP